MFSDEVYIQRRLSLKKQIGQGVILLMGNEQSSINYTDNQYPFRQDSSFLYFFGIDRPGLAAILDIDHNKDIIFGTEMMVEDMVWTGPVPSLSESAGRCGITTVRPSGDLKKKLDEARSKNRKIHYLPPYRPENLLHLSKWLGMSPKQIATGSSVTLIEAVVFLRSVKSREEITEIEKAINITAQMQRLAGQLARPGNSEMQIAAELHAYASGQGYRLSFPMIVTVNGQFLHIQSRENVLKKGDLLLCDCGAETPMGYAGDLTRTFPVDDSFTSRQKEIYRIVLEAHSAAIAALRPGVLFKDVHLLACHHLVRGLKALGLMKGDATEAVAAGAHALFFPCGLGHLMGLDVHDMEDLGEQYTGYTKYMKKNTLFGLKSLRLGRALQEGFVITVEPGIYFIPDLIDQWKNEKKFEQFICYAELEKYKSFSGIRVEDDLEITADGHRILGDFLTHDTELLKSDK